MGFGIAAEKKDYIARQEKKIQSYCNTAQQFFSFSNAGGYKWVKVFLTTDRRMSYVTKVISINNSAV